MRTYIALAALLGSASIASAQNPFIYKPIDANRLLVKPTDAAAALTTGATNSTFRTITRSVAGAIEGNGFVKTINNVLGRRAKPPMPQPGMSALPQATSFQSTAYPNSFKPAMPIATPYGKSPSVVLPTSPSPIR